MEHVIHRLFANLFMNEYLLLTSLFSPKLILQLTLQFSSLPTLLLCFQLCVVFTVHFTTLLPNSFRCFLQIGSRFTLSDDVNS